MLCRQGAPEEACGDDERDIHESLFVEKPCEEERQRGDDYRYTEANDHINPKESADLIWCDVLSLHRCGRQSKVLKLFSDSREGGHHAEEAKILGCQNPGKNGD